MNTPSHASSSVGQVANAYRGNPQALMQRTQPQNGVTPELIDLLAMQKLQAEKQAAASQMAMQQGQAQPTVAQGMEQQAMQSARQEIVQKLGLPGLANQGQNVPQGGQPAAQAPQGAPPVQKLAAGGLVGIPSNLPDGYAGGGIVSFEEGGAASDPSEARLIPLGVAAAIAAGSYAMPQLNSLASGLGYSSGAQLLRAASAQMASSVAPTLPKSAMGKLGVAGLLGATAATTAGTPTEDYRKRFAMETDDPSFLGDVGVRALGAASDLGSAATFGYADKFFRDKQGAGTPAAPGAPRTQAAAAVPPTEPYTEPAVEQPVKPTAGGLGGISARVSGGGSRTTGAMPTVAADDGDGLRALAKTKLKEGMNADPAAAEAAARAEYQLAVGAGQDEGLAALRKNQEEKTALHNERKAKRGETFLGMNVRALEGMAAAPSGGRWFDTLGAGARARTAGDERDFTEDSTYLETMNKGITAMNAARAENNKGKYDAAKAATAAAMARISGSLGEANKMLDSEMDAKASMRNADLQAATSRENTREMAAARLQSARQHASDRGDRISQAALDNLSRRADAVAEQAAKRSMEAFPMDDAKATQAGGAARDAYLNQSTEYKTLMSRLGFEVAQDKPKSRAGFSAKIIP